MRVTKDSSGLLVLSTLASWASVAVIRVALVVLIGWATGSERGECVPSAFVVMNPMTALLFFLLGLSLWLKHRRLTIPTTRIATATAALVAFATGMELIGLLIRSQSGIDSWHFQESLARTTAFAFSAGEMAGWVSATR